MKRLLTLMMLMTMLGGFFLPVQPASARMSGPDICKAARNGETIRGYEVVYGRGGSGNEVVLGDDGDNDLRGGTGNDVLCGLGGDDILRGNSGNDILVGGEGDDALRGGSGNNTLIQDGAPTGDDGGDDDGGGEATVCANDAFEDLARAENPSLPFNFEEQCEAYVEGGGTPVAYDGNAPQIFIFDLNDGEGGDCEISVGLKRFGAGQHSVTVTDGNGNAIAGSPFTLSSENDVFTVLTAVQPDVYTATASTGGQTYSHTKAMPTAGTC